MFRVAKVIVTYPSTMRENETLPIDVGYTVAVHTIEFPDAFSRFGGTVNADQYPPQPLKELDRSLKLELSSSGFAIEPKKEIAKQPKSSLPIAQVWTATPKGEGLRYLLLRVDEGQDSGVLAYNFSYSASVNGAPAQPDAGGYYRLPVSVSTYWGVSHVVASVVAGALALAAFILTYPLVVKLIQRRANIDEKQDKDTDRTG